MQRKRQQCHQETVWWCGGNRSQIEWVRVWSGTREQKRHLGSPAEESNGQIARAGPQNWGGFVFRLAEPWEYFWNEEKTSGRTCGEGGNWGARKVARKQNNKTGDCFESGKVQKSTFSSEVQKSSRSSGEVFLGGQQITYGARSSDLYFSGVLVAKWEVSGREETERRAGPQDTRKVGESAVGNGQLVSEEVTGSAKPGGVGVGQLGFAVWVCRTLFFQLGDAMRWAEAGAAQNWRREKCGVSSQGRECQLWSPRSWTGRSEVRAGQRGRLWRQRPSFREVRKLQLSGWSRIEWENQGDGADVNHEAM